jgi:hypothetical protein
MAATPPGSRPVVTLAHGSLPERITRLQLGRFFWVHNLEPWLFTRTVVIDETTIPHSHPVLTLHARHLRQGDELLSTFLHEQLHWFMVANRDSVQRALPELRARFPGLPVGYPEGADSERSSYEHLPIIYLEYESLRRLVGERRADETMGFWERDHYRALYRLVRENLHTVRSLTSRHGLVPDFLRPVDGAVVAQTAAAPEPARTVRSRLEGLFDADQRGRLALEGVARRRRAGSRCRCTSVQTAW